MRYSGGLDGLRGVAVLVVVLFHAQVPGLDGGFLGVSLFFTLSGFLITSLLLDEFESSGTISLRRFYVRRARRLLPAAYVCLLLVAAFGVWWSAGQRAALPGDLIAAVANVANWRFAFASTDYADLFVGAPSPLAHFWSLAIEEQIYLVLPIVVVLALARGRRTLAWVTGILLGASLVATVLTSDRDLVYNGTHTRAAELLVGVALALLVNAPWSPRMIAWRRWRWLPGGVAAVVFLGLVVSSSLEQDWIYRGGLPAVALVSAVLIAAVVSEQFPNRLLDVGPLVALGRYSYGIYLFHWPLFLLVDAERTGLAPVPLFVVRCVSTGVLAVASARLLEQPVRLGRLPRTTGRFVGAAVAGAAAVVLAAAVVPPPGYSPTQQLLALGDQGVVDFAVAAEPVALDGSNLPTAPVPQATASSEPFRVVVTGSDSSAVDAVLGGSVRLGGELDDDLDIVVLSDVRPGCPLSVLHTPGCPPLAERLAAIARSRRIDAVVIATGAAEDAELDARSAAADSTEEMVALAASQTAASETIEALIRNAAVDDVDVVLYSAGRRFGGFDDQLVQVALASPNIRTVVRNETELASAVRIRARADRLASGRVGADATRVLVIGDSTSLSLAMALSDGSDSRLDVLWAGANGCPLAPVAATRVERGAEWTSHECEPYDSKLPALVRSFAPEAVLIVSGPTELSEHRFGDEVDGHVAGDPAFVAARDAALARISTLVGTGVPVLVADVPAVQPGGFATDEMTGPERVAALNEQILAWDQASLQVTLFPYRETLEAAEVAPGALRSDGVHPDAVALEDLARTFYVDRLLDLVERTRDGLAISRAVDG